MSQLKQLGFRFLPGLALALIVAQATTALAADSPPDLATRVADLEAYVTNGAPKALASSGPGHNAWMMTSTALVLFMTLPGLALFYGGLVRRKNVLSVIAQCFGTAALVTVLWCAVGYSFVFASGSPFLGSLKFALFNGVTSAPEHRLRLLGVAERVQHLPADVRHHHPGPDRGRHRRAHEVLGHHGVHRRLDAAGVLPAGPHGVGHRRLHERRLERQGQRSRPSTSPAAPWCTCPRAGRR